MCIYLPIHWHQLPIIKLREKVDESNAELVIAQIIDDFVAFLSGIVSCEMVD